MQQVAPTSDLFATRFNKKIAQFVSPVPDPRGQGSRYTRPVWGGSGSICLPTSSHFGQSGGEVTGLPMQENHSDCSWVAQHALVLGSSSHIKPDSSMPAQPFNTAFQSY